MPLEDWAKKQQELIAKDNRERSEKNKKYYQQMDLGRRGGHGDPTNLGFQAGSQSRRNDAVRNAAIADSLKKAAAPVAASRNDSNFGQVISSPNARIAMNRSTATKLAPPSDYYNSSPSSDSQTVDPILGANEAQTRLVIGGILGVAAMWYLRSHDWSTLFWTGGSILVVGALLAKHIIRIVVVAAICAVVIWGFKTYTASDIPTPKPVVTTQQVAPVNPHAVQHHSKGAKKEPDVPLLLRVDPISPSQPTR